MQFADAIQNLRDGYAAKRSTWGGYVKKVVTSAPDAEVETYKLIFQVRTGSTTYEYEFKVVGGVLKWVAPSTKVPFDAEIIEAMLADDWSTGKTDDFEAARSGSGIW